MAKLDPAILAHLEWIGFVRPTGLVVSAPALVRAGAILDRRDTCRQLGDALVEAWHAHGEMPAIPADEDEVIFARRLIAQRCLYGVDRNPVAVDLAKVSLWLVTLAKDHALTFVDHALRHGDSLVGLSRKQIEAFHWDPDAPRFQSSSRRYSNARLLVLMLLSGILHFWEEHESASCSDFHTLIG